jgi:hypothetical protein
MMNELVERARDLAQSLEPSGAATVRTRRTISMITDLAAALEALTPTGEAGEIDDLLERALDPLPVASDSSMLIRTARNKIASLQAQLAAREAERDEAVEAKAGAVKLLERLKAWSEQPNPEAVLVDLECDAAAFLTRIKGTDNER